VSIPRIIHAAWFGGNEKPDIIKYCMDSWARFLPDYQVQIWDETNFDVNICSYVRDAYKTKKWAYVSDYVRLWALSNYGGVYMDLDVEVVKPLDKFLHHKAFTGHETKELMLAATMGAEAHHPWISYLLGWYHNTLFNPNLLIPNTQIVTALSRSWVYQETYDFKYLHQGVVIYPADVFAPFNHQYMKPTPTEHTHCIHHFAGSWLEYRPELNYNVIDPIQVREVKHAHI